MGGVVKTGVVAHDNACLAAEVTRQAAVQGLTTGPSAQASYNAAEIAYHRAVIASCKANLSNVGLEASMSALRNLGTGGV
jgi:hypothetical protein